ncbi:MAG: FecCD family ABC transporter permease [Nevskiaceae bacterium]
MRTTVPAALTLALLCLAAAALGLATGPLDIGAGEILRIVLGRPALEQHAATVLDIRLPRVLLALLIGAALAQAGAAMQGIFRNPLAEPGLVGISSGAALAAVAVIVLLPAGLFKALPAHVVLPLAAFAGGAAAAALVLRLALVDGHTRVATLLLAGLALNAIAGAGIGFFSHVASDTALRSVTFWMFGSLGRAGWQEIAVAAPLLVLPLALLPRDAQALNALLLGEAEAGHLGVDVERLKRRVTVLVILAAGAAVALAGIIAFVGLLVPHLVRLAFGPDHRGLLVLSALSGALLLSLADTAARVVMAPTELPIGILTALVGGPFFLALLLRRRHELEP